MPHDDHDLVLEELLVAQRAVVAVRFAHADAEIRDAVAHGFDERAVRQVGEGEAQRRMRVAQCMSAGSRRPATDG